MSAAERVREARERMDCDYLCEHPEGDVERSAGRMCQECLDAYAAAVRAETLTEVREAVEAVNPRDSAASLDFIGHATLGLYRSDVLATLSKLEAP